MTEAVTPVATPPVIHALLDQAREKNWSEVLGVRARPEWTGPAEFTHGGMPVRVVPCVSALAVREALLSREPGTWLVVLTDRDESDLGVGLLSHLAWHRLRTPDPWDAVRQRFAASGIDPAITAGPTHREIAVGLLLAAPAGTGWPPALGGVLTRDHALGSVARAHLALGAEHGDLDAAAVLHWSTASEAAERIAALRALAGDQLADATLAWIGERCGAASSALRRLLVAGDLADALPLGLVLELLVGARGGDAAQAAHDALIRLESRLGAAARDARALEAWGREAGGVAAEILGDHGTRNAGERIVARAQALLGEMGAGVLAADSDMLPAGLTGRLGRLAAALRTAVGEARARAAAVDGVLVRPDELTAIEHAWAAVRAHRLGGTDRRPAAFRAAVRLARWLGQDVGARPVLADLVGRHVAADSWVDLAVNDAASGVDDPELGSALTAVLAAVRDRRDAHDRAFAHALAAHTRDDPVAQPAGWGRQHRGVRHVEDLLPDVVARLARTAPVLLLVVDGMSVAVANELTARVLDRAADGWLEALVPDEGRRCAALAALPTVTDVSRASLLCGALRTGGQAEERRGYGELVRACGLAKAALFHKAPLESSRPGLALADDVAAAVDDVTTRLVTCVLNTVDDALDRSDPAGIDWRPEVVKHLDPLLDRARRAGRIVVLTSDHGHVVERRTGTRRAHQGISSARSRPGDGPPPTSDEVLVTGDRVLRHDGSAVLAVTERLRYGPLKAGYHGGAAPAEVVVPLLVLVPGAVPEDVALQLAPPQDPAWWTGPVRATSAEPAAATTARAAPSRPRQAQEALFDAPVPAEPAPPPGTPDERGSAASVADAVLRSTTYRAQLRIAGRTAVTPQQVRALLVAMLAAPGHRLPPTRAAVALQVPVAALRGAFAHVTRLLNVDGYPVVRIDEDGATIVLDADLLAEQFEVPT